MKCGNVIALWDPSLCLCNDEIHQLLSFLLWKYTLKFQIRFGIHAENSKAGVHVYINIACVRSFCILNKIQYEHVSKIEYISKSYRVEYINVLNTRFAHLYIASLCSFVYYFLFLGRLLWQVIIPCHVAPMYTPFISIVYLLQQLWSKPHFSTMNSHLLFITFIIIVMAIRNIQNYSRPPNLTYIYAWSFYY